MFETPIMSLLAAGLQRPAPEPFDIELLKSCVSELAKLAPQQAACLDVVLEAAAVPVLWPGVKADLERSRQQTQYKWINPWTGRPD